MILGGRLDQETKQELKELIRPEYTQKELAKMRMQGQQKPEGITWAQWMAPFSLKPQHEKILYLAAMGHNASRIADEMGMSLQSVSKILQSDRGQFRIAELQHHLYGKSIKKRFQSLASKAADVVENVLDDQNAKANIRLKAADMILDRAFGKPKQTIDQNVTNNQSIFEKIDELLEKSGKIVETTCKHGDIEEAEIVKKDEIVIEKEIDAIDEWCKKNL